MAGLDLSGIGRLIGQWAIDDLRITRQEGVGDDTLDPATWQLTSPADSAVWAGKGAVLPIASGTVGWTRDDNADVARIVEETDARYVALIALDAVVPAQVGDTLHVDQLHSPSADPRLAGTRYEVVHLGAVASIAAVRNLYLKPL